MINDATIPELNASALAKAKKAAGGNSGLARALGAGISPQAISQWRQVPAERVISVEKVTGVSRSELRSDIYPLEERVTAA
jgi:DNA-binding transcriptional regulator YdaS (Cro superfamily)